MSDLTFQQLQCFDGVARAGSFQAAAAMLGRTHPSVFAAIKNLEAQLGFALFDRSGYRVSLTAEGRAFHARARTLLDEFGDLRRHAEQLASGEETSLRVVIGDLCPLPATLGFMRAFFDTCERTRLDLHFEAITGPSERLLADDADLMIHHVDETDPRFESVGLFSIELIPVVAKGFLKFPVWRDVTPKQMRDYVQCIIRDSARASPIRDYYLIEGARNVTVSDQLMKKEIILQGVGWGHMPDFLVASEIAAGSLVSIEGRHFRRREVKLVAARVRDRVRGPVAERLWKFIAREARAFSSNKIHRRRRNLSQRVAP